MELNRIIALSALVVSLQASEQDKDKKPIFTPAEQEMFRQGGMGSDAGMKVGLVTVAYIGKGLVSAAGSIKAGVCSAFAWAKGTAVAVAAAPAAPYVAGGAVVAGGGYAAYRHFYPTKEQQAKNAERERKKQADLEEAEIVKCRRQRAGSVKAFQDCLYKNRRSRSFTSTGYPTECEDEGLKLSLEDGGESEVVSLASRFVRFAPIKKDSSK